MLESHHVAAYRADGCLMIDGVIPSAEVEALRAACTEAAVVRDLDARNQRDESVHLHPLTPRHAAFRAIARDPRLIGIVSALIGPQLQLQQSKLVTKPPTPGRGTFGWHQDFAFFPHTNADLLAVSLLLDDSTRDNGCLRVVRGSHAWGLLDHSTDGVFTGVCVEQRWSDPERIVDLTPRAGGITIHHVLALHGSEATRSGRPRRSLVFQYRAGDALQLSGKVFDDTGWRICGGRADRVRCEARELPRWQRGGDALEAGVRQEGACAAAWNERE